jgi:mannose-6-phosphate isomerase-like protein (cupin superfamily)
MPESITRDELRAAIDHGSAVVVDALPPAPFGERHLPGAINVVAEDRDDQLDDVLPDKDAAIVTYSTDADCARGPELAARLEALGWANVRVYAEGIEDWVGAGLPVERPQTAVIDLADLRTSPTAALFEGNRRAGVDISMFITRTPPGRAVPLHVHPYAETFVLLEGRGRWTAGDKVLELEPDQMVVVPPETPHGFRNIGDVPLLVVSVHERGTMRQTWLGDDPA